DGIRDDLVTGVQTCALPISAGPWFESRWAHPRRSYGSDARRTTLKDQLRLLIELQVHDAKIQELEGTLKAYPAQFEAMQTDVRQIGRASCRGRQRGERGEEA